MFWLEKDISKVENTLLQWILQNILENQTFQRIAKFSFDKGQTSSPWEIQLQRKKLILQYRWHWNTLIRRSKKIEMDENSNF